MGILIAFLTLGVVIFVHELGHFIVARLFRVKVENFSIGFGPKLISFRRKETEYCLRLIPFGGFVKMAGEDILTKDQTKTKITPDMFIAQPVRKRIGIVGAGPISNLIFGFLVCTIVFIIGVKSYILKPVIGKVEKESLAYKAGIKPRDIILKINNKGVRSWDDIERLIFNEDNCQILIKSAAKNNEYKYLVINLRKPKHALTEDIGIEPYVGPRVGSVVKGLPAHVAGIKPKDIILKINDTQINSWVELTKIIHNNPNKLLKLEVKRKDKILTFLVKTKKDKIIKDNKIVEIGRIGIEPQLSEVVLRHSIKDAIYNGFIQTFITSPMYIYIVIKGLREKKVEFSDFAGPVGIMHFAAKQAEGGLDKLLFFIAFLSSQLFILNLLPIPILDGGHIILLLIEGIRRRPISYKIQVCINIIGISLLVSLILLVTYNDILRLIFK